MEQKKEPFPTFFDQIKNLSQSAKDIVYDAVTGNQIVVSEEVKQNRMDICNSCEKNDGGKCRACGCFLEVKTKFASSYCPIMKWTSV